MAGVRGRRLLLVGIVIGLLVGGPLGAILAPGSIVPAPAPDDTPPVAYSSSSGCYDGPRKNAGWLYVAANGKTWAVSLNTTVVHPRGTKIDVNVSRRPMGTYEIALDTNDTTTEKPRPPEGCRVATKLDISTGLAEPNFVVSVDGRIVRSVDQDETAANLYPLPKPLNASD